MDAMKMRCQSTVGTERKVSGSCQSPVPDPEKCLICLNAFSGQAVATPENCEHFFCVECIIEWSKNTNSCPVDRMGFDVIYQRKCFGGEVVKIVKVERPLRLGEQDVSEDLAVCEECGRSDRGHLMLLCSSCDSGYHMDCLSPPPGAGPSQRWFCQECVVTSPHTSDHAAEEEVEVDADEITDLLAETVPTSSRLRPSTTRRPPAETCTRTSERILTRASRNPTTPSHTVQHVPNYLLKSTWPVDEEVASRSGATDVYVSSQKPHKSSTRKR